MDTHAQSGNAVNVRRKPKHKLPRTRVLPMKAARNTRSLHMGLPSSGFIFALTPGLSGAGPRAQKCKQERPTRVHSRPMVGPLYTVLSVCRFHTAAMFSNSSPASSLGATTKKWWHCSSAALQARSTSSAVERYSHCV